MRTRGWQRIEIVLSSVVAAALYFAAPAARATEATLISLSCDGSVMDIVTSEPGKTQSIKIDLVINLTEGTVSGFDRFIASIDGADDTSISFKGESFLGGEDFDHHGQHRPYDRCHLGTHSNLDLEGQSNQTVIRLEPALQVDETPFLKLLAPRACPSRPLIDMASACPFLSRTMKHALFISSTDHGGEASRRCHRRLLRWDLKASDGVANFVASCRCRGGCGSGS